MSKYLEVQNTDNIVTIDDTFRNYCLIRKFKPPINYMSDYNSSSYKTEQYNIYPERANCILFCSKTTSDSLFFASWANPAIGMGTSWSGSINFYNLNNQDIGPYLSGIDIYEFGVVDNQQSANFGLQTFNDQGQKVFDSNFKYLNLIDAIFDYSNSTTSDYEINGARNLFNLKRVPTKQYGQRIAVCGLALPGGSILPFNEQQIYVVMPNNEGITVGNRFRGGPIGGASPMVTWNKLSVLIAAVNGL